MHADMEALVQRGARSLQALFPAVEGLDPQVERNAVAQAVARGYFRPSEDEAVVTWFARLLTVREGLWQVIAEVSEPLDGDPRRVTSEAELELFLLGYVAACLVVRLDRTVVEDLARSSLAQRKLNEGDVLRRVPRKQFTAIYESLSNPRNALVMREAMKVRERESARILELRGDLELGEWIDRLPELERTLDPSPGRFLRLLLSFGGHALRRQGASTKQQVTFSALETGGRLVAELHAPGRARRVDAELRERIRELLRPGDVLVTRQDLALSNLFLPGFWPHAALFVGSPAERDALGVRVDRNRRARWSEDRCVLEAQKDGVRFRRLEQTLAVDAVAIIRPRLTDAERAAALGRGAGHEGKLYNFDFDFFRSDRLVCTEVVYRAFDGVGGLRFELRERAGRMTFSAEDLLDLALDSDSWTPIALVGAPRRPSELIVGAELAEELAATYRRCGPPAADR